MAAPIPRILQMFLRAWAAIGDMETRIIWTLEDLRRFLEDRRRCIRWRAVLAQLRARDHANFGDLR